MEELMIKIDGVSKKYRLGQIGGTTLKEELQRVSAKLRNVEDPTRRIGAKEYNNGEVFSALDNVSFEVKKGEKVGIIGHNGAGKSTLLKLLSRVTAPSEGTIGLNGRIASMLEVGTGFHPELTGRENIYMNGAILGMTRKEIDAKIDDIIEFSECSQFIDTPVKRYSSGMYVKLAFAVAAHLDSEIMIMDEVLAVGDMAFQKKCLDKMNSVSKTEGRTILYVSHNMATIRELCERCIVLSQGKIVFDGDVEEAIDVYMSGVDKFADNPNHMVFTDEMHELSGNWDKIVAVDVEKENNIFERGEKIPFKFKIIKQGNIGGDIHLRCVIRSKHGVVTTAPTAKPIKLKDGENEVGILLDTANFAPASFTVTFILYTVGDIASYRNLDILRDVYPFTVKADKNFNKGIRWSPRWWGYSVIPELEVCD